MGFYRRFVGGTEEGNLVVAPAASLRPSAEWKASATLACFGPAEAVPFGGLAGRVGGFAGGSGWG